MTIRFFIGLLISALGYATHNNKGKVKGIQVNDPSAIILGTNDSGALKLHIDRQDLVALTLVHY